MFGNTPIIIICCIIGLIGIIMLLIYLLGSIAIMINNYCREIKTLSKEFFIVLKYNFKKINSRSSFINFLIDSIMSIITIILFTFFPFFVIWLVISFIDICFA